MLLGLFLKQGGEVNYFCLNQIQHGLNAFAANLYPNFPWWGGGGGGGGGERGTVTLTDLHLQIYSTGHGNCSIYTRVNCVQYGGFTRKMHVKNTHVELHEA